MAYQTAHTQGKNQIYGIIRRMNKGLLLGFVVIVIGPVVGYMLWSQLKYFFYAIGLTFLLTSLRYQVQAWLLVRRLEKSREAEDLYRQLETESQAFPAVNCLLTSEFLVSVGGRTGMEILKLSDIEHIEEYRYYKKEGDSRELRLSILGQRTRHIVAFIRTEKRAQPYYDEFLAVFQSLIPKAPYVLTQGTPPRRFKKRQR